jgi:hypothetical protein
MTFAELCKIDETGSLTALLEEAKKPKDSGYCFYQFWDALPRERGLVGIKRLAENVIERNPALHPHRERILLTLYEAAPACKHAPGECPHLDYPLPPLSPEIQAGKMESVKRELPGMKGGNLLAMLREAAEKANG